MVEVYRAVNLRQALVIKAALEGSHIDVFLDNEHIQSLTYGISSIVSMSPAIYVPAKDVEKVKQIIAGIEGGQIEAREEIDRQWDEEDEPEQGEAVEDYARQYEKVSIPGLFINVLRSAWEIKRLLILVIAILSLGLILSLFKLNKSDLHVPKIYQKDLDRVKCMDLALIFAEALASRDYGKAYSMTTIRYQQGHTVDQIRDSFEAIIPFDWNMIGPIDLDNRYSSWGIPWTVGVSIGGCFSSGIQVFIAFENKDYKVIRFSIYTNSRLNQD